MGAHEGRQVGAEADDAIVTFVALGLALHAAHGTLVPFRALFRLRSLGALGAFGMVLARRPLSAFSVLLSRLAVFALRAFILFLRR